MTVCKKLKIRGSNSVFFFFKDQHIYYDFDHQIAKMLRKFPKLDFVYLWHSNPNKK